ncbi:hypothetical protein QFC19_002862 [Naganishia cerealis]|nr:hypothetical protein QFC19_002862 [Naganishia cerealis]
MKSLDTALSLLRTPSSTWQPGLQSVKINNVLTRSSNLSELVDFVRLTQAHPISVRFIEFMPFSGNKWDRDEMVPYDEALGIIRREFGAENVVPLSNEDGDGTSKRWRIKGWKGEIGFISSMVRRDNFVIMPISRTLLTHLCDSKSDHFCGTCNRLRITADGNLKVCLFDNTEVSLRDVLRTTTELDSRQIDENLMDVIAIAVGNKKAKHAVRYWAVLNFYRDEVLINSSLMPLHSSIPYHRQPGTSNVSLTRSTASATMYPYLKIRNNPVVYTSHDNYRSPSSLKHSVGRMLMRQQHTSASDLRRSSEETSGASLTHLDASGRASMVSISNKMPTTRRATATGRIYLPAAAFSLLANSPSGGKFKKGDVLGTARIAGIMAGKKTSELIPLCHPIGLTDLKVRFRLEAEQQQESGEGGGWVGVQAMAECEGKTGVEVRPLDIRANQIGN